MHRWWGSKDDSEKQAGDRNQRAARRVIRNLSSPEPTSSGDEYAECETSGLFNLDGNDSVTSEEAVIMATPFELEKGTDDDDYYKKIGNLKNRTFNTSEPEFWFTSIEASMKHMGVKSQWSKREVLHSLLPDNVQTQVKHILKKGQDQAGEFPYKTLKHELLKKYAPKPEAAYVTAQSRKLSDTPSALAKQLIDDLCLCNEPLASKCCQRIIWGMWTQKLPDTIRQRLAGESFTNENYESLLDLADSLHATNQAIGEAKPAMAIAAVKNNSKSDLNETQPAIPYAVNAVQRGGRGGGGRGRGQNSFRGNGRGRGNRGGNNNRGGQNQSATPQWPTTRHADLPASVKVVCFNHHTYGRGAYHCTDPLSCEWASIPPAPRQKPVNN